MSFRSTMMDRLLRIVGYRSHNPTVSRLQCNVDDDDNNNNDNCYDDKCPSASNDAPCSHQPDERIDDEDDTDSSNGVDGVVLNENNLSFMAYLYESNPSNNSTSQLELGDTQQNQQPKTVQRPTVKYGEELDVPFPSFWDLMLTLYIPILVQSFFGTIYIARSILLGYGLPYVCHLMLVFVSKIDKSRRWQQIQHSDCGGEVSTTNLPLAAASTTAATAATTVSVLAADPTSKGSSSIWQHRTNSPPAVIAILAILTIAALIVHPDGHTWILFRKIRYVTNIYAAWMNRLMFRS
jgi:hypothetical protein